jgi:hypothetical protein
MVRKSNGMVLVLAAGLVLVLAVPASAGHVITYRGRTSQDRLVVVKVLKRDSGRRFLRSFFVRASARCDDGSVQQMEIGMQPRPVPRLDDMGQFELGEPLDAGRLYAIDLHAVGMARFRQAAGTTELLLVGSTTGEEARTCETGVLEWTAQRHRIRPTRPN